jgi:hypothetical protein
MMITHADPSLGNRTPEQYLDDMFQELFLNPALPAAETARRWVHPDVRQFTDGHQVPLEQQIRHLEFVRANATELSFDVQQVVYDGRTLAERHLGHIAFADGRVVDSEVTTFFTIVDGLIVAAHEVTRPLSGAPGDREVHTAH